MSPRLSRLVLSHVRHNITAPFAHRPQVCDGQSLLFVLSLFLFWFVFFFSFSRSLLTVFPQGLSHRDAMTPLLLVNLSGGWSPFFFESMQPHHAAVTADDVWFGFRSFFGSFFRRSHRSSSPLFFSLVPLACNEEGCLTLKSLFISRVGCALPCPIGTWHSPLHDTPQHCHHACIFSWLGYCTRGILHLSS